jgi:hypothetical protein
LSRAARWFQASGIQSPNGGVARYYRSDTAAFEPISTEITGYAVSALVYLGCMDEASRGAKFLAEIAWDPAACVMPFEIDPPRFTYFFDCGIIVRALLASWRVSRCEEWLARAIDIGDSMTRDFEAKDGYHPILSLPDKRAVERDPLRWSRAPGCYQLKSAMAWWNLAEATGEQRFRSAYERALELALHGYGSFLPGHPEVLKVMDRLHAFLYFLEGLLPVATETRAKAALCDGVRRVGALREEIAPEFERSDVIAQLLRIRLYADWAGAVPLNCGAAEREASLLAGYQAEDGGFYFGRRDGKLMPFVNPVSACFAVQALSMWDQWRNRGMQASCRDLI